MHRLFRAAAALSVAALLLAGCDSADAWASPHPIPTPKGTLAPGFVYPTSTPSPGATITPKPGSWDDVHPSAGYRVVLLTYGGDAATKTVATAVKDWAKAEHVDLRTMVPAGDKDTIPSITKAIGMKPDLIVSAGNGLIDPLTVVTASNLQQRFLIVGAELAEPTYNVTAVDWPGASFRGEGLDMSSAYDPATFTPTRSAAAIRAGVAAVLSNITGIVVWLAA